MQYDPHSRKLLSNQCIILNVFFFVFWSSHVPKMHWNTGMYNAKQKTRSYSMTSITSGNGSHLPWVSYCCATFWAFSSTFCIQEEFPNLQLFFKGNKCVLGCFIKGTGLGFAFGNAEDGTNCEKASPDKCIQGQCMVRVLATERGNFDPRCQIGHRFLRILNKWSVRKRQKQIASKTLLKAHEKFCNEYEYQPQYN